MVTMLCEDRMDFQHVFEDAVPGMPSARATFQVKSVCVFLQCHAQRVPPSESLHLHISLAGAYTDPMLPLQSDSSYTVSSFAAESSRLAPL